MSNNLTYGGIIYPDNSFVFDKIYNNFKEANDNVDTDTVLVGRYILVAYCNTSFTKDERTRIESNWSAITNPTADELAYHTNFLIDNVSKDRKVYRKTYQDGHYAYQEIISLHPDLSNNSIAVLGLAENEKILAVDKNRTLSSTLNLVYDDKGGDIKLLGIDNVEIASIPTTDFIADGVFQRIEINDKNNTLTFYWTNYNKENNTVVEKSQTVNLYDIIDPYKSGNGITVTSIPNENPTIAIKLNTNTETFLTVDSNGLKLSGVQNAINTAKTAAIQAAENTVKLVTNENAKGVGTNVGDICIVKSLIDDSDHYSYTAYTWQKAIGTVPAHWEAMDGNYNAENIYFGNDIMVTKEIGYITLTNGNGKIPSKGKNLVQVFDSMFTKEEDPSKTDPSVSITLNKAGSYEVGETVTGITCSVSFNDGTYSYGPEPTGAKVNSWEIKDSNNKTYTYSDFAISIPNILVTDGINYTITAKATHSIGDIPKTNKGNNCTDTSKRIAAGTQSNTSSAITGYRYAFAGGTSANVLSSSIIRGMSAKKKSKTAMDSEGEALEFSATKGTTKVFFAYPSTWTGTPYFEMFGLAWAENVNFIQKANIQVADARGGSNGLSSYKLYMWELNPGLEADNTNFRVWFK